jgi:hypothetical protein
MLRQARAATRRRGNPSALDISGLAAELARASTLAEPGGDVLASLNRLSAIAPRAQGLRVAGEEAISPYLAWLPYSLDEALAQLGLTRIVNERLRAGFYRDRLIVLATQEKSASTLHDVVLLKMLEHTAGQATINPLPRGLKGGPLAMAGHTAFHFGLLLHYPDGGVVRGEFDATPQNIWMIHRTLGLRTVVLTRHPADRLVALYCMRHQGLRDRMKNHGIKDTSEESVLSNLFTGSTKTLPANIGSLRHNLEWMESWVYPEARERAVIARYEDMLVNPEQHFRIIHSQLFDTPMTDALREAVKQALAASGEGGALQSGDKHTRSYAKGYSGKIGVWMDYLTQANVDAYNDVVKRFLDYTPIPEQILDIYPDLILDRTLAATGGRPVFVKQRVPVDLEAIADVMRTAEDEAANNRVVNASKKLNELLANDPLETEIPTIFKRLEWLPHTTREGVKFASLARLASKRLKEGYYRDRLVILTAQEKSGSTMHAVAVKHMLRSTGGVSVYTTLPRQKTSSPTTMAGGTVFHAGMVLYSPNGGVCRGVFDPSRDNKLYMSETGARRIVLTRHPADRVVAQYCMHLSATDRDMEASLATVINAHVETNLVWLNGWVSDKGERQLVVRYEDMFSDRSRHFERIHNFLYQKDMDELLAAEIDQTFRGSGEGGAIRSGNLGTRVYKRGYSGKIGVWRDYMTPANVALFNAIVDRFVALNPNGRALFDTYPDLRLDAGELNLEPAGEPGAGAAESANAQQAVAPDGQHSAANSLDESVA